MQKISTYLYPNRIQLLADLAGFTTEYTNVYQRTVKIYNGINNTLEFDVKNADQKRIDLSGLVLSLNIMDAAGYGLANSPYELEVLDQDTRKGLATVTIPKEDIQYLKNQYLKYSVTATYDDGTEIILYADSKFGAIGTMQIVDTVIPPVEDTVRVYKDFTSEIDLKGQPTYHSSAFPVTFYESEETTQINIDVYLAENFIGSVWIEGTERSTINTEAFKHSSYLRSQSFSTESPAPPVITFDNIPVRTSLKDYKYFRVSYQTPLSNGQGASFTVTTNNNTYDVVVKSGGTGYGIGSQIKILGSILGGTDGINDLIITVENIEGGNGASSYAVSSITGVSATGLAVNGTSTYIVTGTNITGSVDKIVVS